MSAKKAQVVLSWSSVTSCAVFRVLTIIFLGLVLLATPQLAHARKAPDPGNPLQTGAEQSATGVRAFPRVSLGPGSQLEYVGAFSASGKFKPLTKLGLFVDSMMTASLSGQPPTPLPDAAKMNEQDVTKQVPPSIELHRDEQLVEDFQPPEHAVKVAKGHSVVEELRDSIVSLAYGPEKVLVVPQSVTTDSRQRVIVTDAAAHSVHVLAYAAKDSFEIVGGPGRRLQSPSGVAVDNDDNIYVSDSERGLILVYDSEGRFVRTIGSIGDEGMFQHPTSLSIDGKSGRLYVIDQPRHMLLILDLEGKVLARVGITEAGSGFSSRVGSTEPGRFEAPQSVFVRNDEVIVLDSTRIHILDLEGRFLKEFKISNGANSRPGFTPGVFMDDEKRIYVSDPVRDIVRMYSHDGQFLGAFGHPGIRLGEFNAPAGMWADSAGRIFIVDACRIQVFQLSGAK